MSGQDVQSGVWVTLVASTETFDGLHRLNGAKQGTLNGTQTAITNPRFG